MPSLHRLGQEGSSTAGPEKVLHANVMGSGGPDDAFEIRTRRWCHLGAAEDECLQDPWPVDGRSGPKCHALNVGADTLASARLLRERLHVSLSVQLHQRGR